MSSHSTEDEIIRELPVPVLEIERLVGRAAGQVSRAEIDVRIRIGCGKARHGDIAHPKLRAVIVPVEQAVLRQVVARVAQSSFVDEARVEQVGFRDGIFLIAIRLIVRLVSIAGTRDRRRTVERIGRQAIAVVVMKNRRDSIFTGKILIEARVGGFRVGRYGGVNRKIVVPAVVRAGADWVWERS